jgi:hypothetical protein
LAKRKENTISQEFKGEKEEKRPKGKSESSN